MISNISSSSVYSGIQRPDPAQIANQMFSNIDTTGKGYIDKKDLQVAFDKTSSNGMPGNASSVDEVFTKLDGNGDGKITKQEMTDGVTKLVDQLNSQLRSSQASGKSGPPPGGPPPGGGAPPAGGDGAASASGSSSSSTTSSNTTYAPADTNQDGQVSEKEKVAYAAKIAAKSSSASESTNQSSEAAVMKRIMDLVRIYTDSSRSSSQSVASSSLSLTA